MVRRKVLLLDLPKRDARRRVARHDDQLRAAVEQLDNAFERVPVNDVERARTVRRSGIIAKIGKRIVRKLFTNLPRDAQASEARIKEPQHSHAPSLPKPIVVGYAPQRRTKCYRPSG